MRERLNLNSQDGSRVPRNGVQFSFLTKQISSSNVVSTEILPAMELFLVSFEIVWTVVHMTITDNSQAFLRKMEYFGGLLFWTTNRVGHIDEAFISRVHVIIGFDKLDPPKRRKIWQNFLKKLDDEQRGKIRVTPQASKFVLGEEICAMDWNGREIRNSFQTAIALVEYDVRESEFSREGNEILVEADHFKQVMEMSRKFRTYMNSIRRDTEEERAKAYYGRNDYMKSDQIS